MSWYFGANNALANGAQRGAANWNREENGAKVRGNHKTTGSTRKPETLAEIGGKINICLQNFKAKTATWNYPQELDRYIGELTNLGGSLSANQRLKLVALSHVDDRAKTLIEKYNLSSNRAEVEEPVGENPEIVQARRPEDTPTRPPEQVKRRRLHGDAAEARITTTTEGAAASEEDVVQGIEDIEVDPVEPVAAAPATTDMAAMVPSGGSTPEGFGGSQTIRSHAPIVKHDPVDNCEVVIFGGSRIMYSWAYDMYGHNDAGNSEMDFFPLAHQIPWEIIPFYCTPQEFASLDWHRKDIKVARVKCVVKPLAKESQFSTQQDTVTAVSNEHLTMVKWKIGLNKEAPMAAMRYVAGNTVGTTMQVNATSNPDWGKIIDKYWGVLPAWVSGTNPITGGTAGSQPAMPCSFLQYREIETIGGLLVDAYDKTTKANNKRNFGYPLADRILERRTLAACLKEAAEGMPLINLEHHVKNGWISQIPNVPYTTDYNSSGQHDRFGDHHVLNRPANDIGSSNKDSFMDTQDNTFSRNINCGTATRNATGRYLMTVEKSRQINGQSGVAADGFIHTMPSILIGMCPIKPVSINSTLINPVQARCMWQIDYEIEFRQYSHYDFMFPTTYSVDGVTKLPPNIRWSCKPNVMVDPLSWDTSSTYLPLREEGSVQSLFQHYMGIPQQNDSDEVLVTTVAGANYVDPCTTAYNPPS